MIGEEFIEQKSKKMFGVSLALDPIVKIIGQRMAKVAFNLAEIFNPTVMCHQYVFVLEGVTIAFTYVTYAGCPNMGNHAIGLDLRCKIPEVSVIPGWIYGYKRDGLIV